MMKYEKFKELMIMKYNRRILLNIILLISNIAIFAGFLYLAIHFDRWWIIFFAAFFFFSIKSRAEE